MSIGGGVAAPFAPALTRGLYRTGLDVMRYVAGRGGIRAKAGADFLPDDAGNGADGVLDGIV